MLGQPRASWDETLPPLLLPGRAVKSRSSWLLGCLAAWARGLSAWCTDATLQQKATVLLSHVGMQSGSRRPGLAPGLTAACGEGGFLAPVRRCHVFAVGDVTGTPFPGRRVLSVSMLAGSSAWHYAPIRWLFLLLLRLFAGGIGSLEEAELDSEPTARKWI